MQENDILKVVWSGEILGERWNCIGFYRADVLGDGMTESDVATSLFDGWANGPNSVICNTVSLTNVRVDNESDGLGVANFTSLSVGADPGACMPAFVAYGVKQKVNTKLTRAGYKFIPGVAEAAVIGDEIDPIQLPTFENAITPLFGGPRQITVLAGPVDGQISPAVVGRIEDPPDSGKYVLEVTRYQLVNGADLFPAIRSRVSRRQRT